MDTLLDALFARQDQLVTRQQSLTFLSEDQLRSRLGRRWRVVLPGIYASTTDRLTEKQRIRAALLYAGPEAMLTDTTALRACRLPYVPADPQVRVLVPEHVQRGSKDFVTIRRTHRPPQPLQVAGLPCAPIHRAVCEFVARYPDAREGLAVAAAAVQLRRTGVTDLLEEAWSGPARGRPRLLRAIDPLQAGIRSVGENDFRELVLRRPDLPEPLWNCLIRLPDGRCFSPDALFIEAALIHEVNGRESHSEEEAGPDEFTDMHRRADGLITAGFTVLGNAPRRIRTEGGAVINEVVHCYERDKGRGLPPGVVILRAGPPGTPSNVTLLGQSAP